MEKSLALDGHLVSVKRRAYRVVRVITRGGLVFLDRALVDRSLEGVWDFIIRFELLPPPLMEKKLLRASLNEFIFLFSYPLR